MRNARTGKGMTTDEDGSINKDMEMEMDRDTLMLQLHSLLKHDDDNDDDDSGDDGADVDDDDDDDEEYNSSNANANANANAMNIDEVERYIRTNQAIYDHSNLQRKGVFPGGPDAYRYGSYIRDDDNESFQRVSMEDQMKDVERK